MNYLKELLWNGPAAERYMEGGNLGAMMMGVMEPSGVTSEALKRGTIGTTRGLMAQDEEYPE